MIRITFHGVIFVAMTAILLFSMEQEMMQITLYEVAFIAIVAMLLISIGHMVYVNKIENGGHLCDETSSALILCDLLDRESFTEGVTIDRSAFMNNVSLLLNDAAYPLIYKKQTIAYVTKCVKVVGTRAVFKVTVSEDAPRITVPSMEHGYSFSRLPLSCIRDGDLRLTVQSRLSYSDSGKTVTGVRTFHLIDLRGGGDG